jgi:acylphosphatase
MSDTVRYHVDVFGKVQGVSFRNFTETIASMLKLSGTVENKEEKHVEIFVEGNRRPAEMFLKAVTLGSRWSRVDELKIEEQPVTGEIGGFSTIYPVVIPPLYAGIMHFGGYHQDTIPGIITSRLAEEKFECDICYEPSVTVVPDSGGGEPWHLCETHRRIFDSDH